MQILVEVAMANNQQYVAYSQEWQIKIFKRSGGLTAGKKQQHPPPTVHALITQQMILIFAPKVW